VSAADLFQLFGGAGAGVVGVCLIFVALFITDQIVTKGRYEEMKADRDDWKHIAELERARSDAGVATGAIVRDVMLGLRKELE
jgi:hypothetical protein